MSQRGQGKTVLIIDDSDIVIEVTRQALERAGYRVLARNRPSGSVAAILNEKPDVVLLDVNMPTLTGEAIVKILGRTQPKMESIILLHSSLPLDTLRLKALSTGAHGYLQKTDDGDELVRRIEHWIERAKASSSARIRAAQAIENADAMGTVSRDGHETPRIREPLGGPRGAVRGIPAQSGAKRTLFVDDDWLVLNTYRTTMPSLDAEFVTSSEEALKRILSPTPPSVVVCDVVMPFLSGADLYRRAVADHPSWAKRFVFVTGATSTRSVAEFLNGLEARVFFKPVPWERLLDAVQRVDNWGSDRVSPSI